MVVSESLSIWRYGAVWLAGAGGGLTDNREGCSHLLLWCSRSRLVGSGVILSLVGGGGLLVAVQLGRLAGPGEHSPTFGGGLLTGRGGLQSSTLLHFLSGRGM